MQAGGHTRRTCLGLLAADDAVSLNEGVSFDVSMLTTDVCRLFCATSPAALLRINGYRLHVLGGVVLGDLASKTRAERALPILSDPIFMLDTCTYTQVQAGMLDSRTMSRSASDTARTHAHAHTPVSARSHALLSFKCLLHACM